MSDIILMNGHCKITRTTDRYDVTTVECLLRYLDNMPYTVAGRWIIPFMTPSEEANAIRNALRLALRKEKELEQKLLSIRDR